MRRQMRKASRGSEHTVPSTERLRQVTAKAKNTLVDIKAVQKLRMSVNDQNFLSAKGREVIKEWRPVVEEK